MKFNIADADEIELVYLGKPFKAPAWTKFMATEPDGRVAAFSSCPVMGKDCWLTDPSWNLYEDCQFDKWVGEIDLPEGETWQSSVREFGK